MALELLREGGGGPWQKKNHLRDLFGSLIYITYQQLKISNISDFILFFSERMMLPCQYSY